jgi:hypothetical protein
LRKRDLANDPPDITESEIRADFRRFLNAKLNGLLPDLTKAEKEAIYAGLNEAQKERFRGVENARNNLEAKRVSMQSAKEEFQEFKTFDELVRLLRDKRINRRAAAMAADLLENIAKNGYRPPKPSTRHRLTNRNQVHLWWALQKNYMTVEKFKAWMSENFGIPEGTTVKYIYRGKNPYL